MFALVSEFLDGHVTLEHLLFYMILKVNRMIHYMKTDVLIILEVGRLVVNEGILSLGRHFIRN